MATTELREDVHEEADAPTTLLLRYTRVAHAAGYPTADLEERIRALAEAIGLTPAQVSATPTLVEVSIGTLRRQRTFTLRVRPMDVDLAAIARLDDLLQDVVARRVDLAAARASLESIAAKGDRPWPITLLGYAALPAALTPILGGTWHEAAAAALVGLVVGVLALTIARADGMQPVVAPLAAILASFGADALARAGLESKPEVVTLAALLTFLPGMALTIGMRELATQHLQSGVANTANALVQLLGLVVGVAVGHSIARAVFAPTSAPPTHVALGGVHLLAAVGAGLAFTVTLRAQARDAPIMCGATVLALVAYDLARDQLGSQPGVFVAALAVGVAGTLVGAARRGSPLVFVVPGVLMLVPGSAGFNSALQLLTNNTVGGITTAFDTLVTATLIAYGLLLSTVVLPRRLSRIGA